MPRTINYKFEFESGSAWNYELQFDDAHRYLEKHEGVPKEWTRLEFHQCAHCPLTSGTSPHCPVARNLDRVVEDSKTTVSITRAKVTVTTKERTYVKECATQEGLRSLFGVVMASSGCPHLDWLRPMARFHLPFSDLDETLFRVLSVQLVEQLMKGESGDSKKIIEQRYRALEQINQAFAKRIRNYCKADADKNAIAALDVYVQLFPYQVESDFKSLRVLFS